MGGSPLRLASLQVCAAARAPGPGRPFGLWQHAERGSDRSLPRLTRPSSPKRPVPTSALAPPAALHPLQPRRPAPAASLDPHLNVNVQERVREDPKRHPRQGLLAPAALRDGNGGGSLHRSFPPALTCSLPVADTHTLAPACPLAGSRCSKPTAARRCSRAASSVSPPRRSTLQRPPQLAAAARRQSSMRRQST